ncbi:MAG TPA: PQQ-binding-like beta-propeller repeat protein [Gemmataceae bacterium]|nr:PQQ-binding-like beta-propeller repeat protein [Gemmataceae bacterium]
MKRLGFAVMLTALLGLAPAGRAADPIPPAWPQFRGPDGLGVAPDGAKFPTTFGPTSKVLWKVALPPGCSSPCVWGSRIFLTGFDRAKKELATLCLDRGTGKTLWRRAVAPKGIERVHHENSPAVGTPATDGERVYVYFGSYGLVCYDLDGNEAWARPLPVPATMWGSGTSPVVAGGLVLLKCQGRSSSLLALHGRTGEVAWKKEPLPFEAGYSPPFVWRHGDAAEVVLHGQSGVRAYDLKDGTERWSVGGLLGAAIPAPVAAEGMLFVVSQFPGGDQDDRMKLPNFDDLLKKYDKDKDGKLSREEIPGDVVIYRRDPKNKEGDIRLLDLFGSLDMNHDGKLDRLEWFTASTLAGQLLNNSLLALRPAGGRAAVAWREKRSLPEVSSPLVYRGRLYLVKHGGILSCLDARTGKRVYRERLGADGLYFASPVAGDGKIYAAGDGGVVTVFAAGDKLEVLARNDLGEAIKATPALVDGKIYLRTEGHLYAFGE